MLTPVLSRAGSVSPWTLWQLVQSSAALACGLAPYWGLSLSWQVRHFAALSLGAPAESKAKTPPLPSPSCYFTLTVVAYPSDCHAWCSMSPLLFVRSSIRSGSALPIQKLLSATLRLPHMLWHIAAISAAASSL